MKEKLICSVAPCIVPHCFNEEILLLIVSSRSLFMQKGNTALHISSLAGQAEVVKILVKRGADINAQSQVRVCTLLLFHQLHPLKIH